MADISDLHPAIIHALKTGKLDQAHAATGQTVPPASGSVWLTQKRPRAKETAEPPQRRSTEAEDDAFYDGFNNNPLR